MELLLFLLLNPLTMAFLLISAVNFHFRDESQNSRPYKHNKHEEGNSRAFMSQYDDPR